MYKVTIKGLYFLLTSTTVYCVLGSTAIFRGAVSAEVLSAEVLSAEVLQYIINKPAFSPHLRFLLAVYSLSGFWGGIFTLLQFSLLYIIFIYFLFLNILVFRFIYVLLLR